MPQVLAIVMAGGAGTRLSVLSAERSKPAVPFAGKYRIIDFTLSNCVNSGIYNIAILTQYRPHSLNEHIGIGKPWDLDRARGGVRLLQPYQGREGQIWYTGTADAVYQNLDYVREQRADHALILSGDHIYKMDYRPMLRFHQERGADLTVAVMNVPQEETNRFGIMAVDADQRITAFYEKPRARDKGTLASMGIYIFTMQTLAERLIAGRRAHPELDFGKHVIPAMIEQCRVFAYAFDGYWVDVGTLQSYWETNLALLRPDPPLNLYDPAWVIHTLSQERPPVKIGLQGQVARSMVANGCVVRGRIEHSVLSPGVYVSPDALVRDSIVMNDSWIGAGAALDRVIVDKNVVVGAGARLGDGDDFATPNTAEPDRLNTGLTVVGKGAHIPAGIRVGRNVVVQSGAQEEAFAPFGSRVPTGATVGNGR
ncbi:MAG: glucose-1-phosphate adenylyltransferase [Chloroflexi bacterium]|nr:glucose-1-phosphate adenylyltransferase [Chloroflexota bacterium]